MKKMVIAVGVAALTLLWAGPAPAEPWTSEAGTDRPGNDINWFDLDLADPKLCQEACQKNAQCKAYTYAPGTGTKARCWLKSAIPNAVANDCCVSGIDLRAMTIKPEITNIMPKGPDNDPAAMQGKPFTVFVKNFAPDAAKTTIAVRKLSMSPSFPPASSDIIKTITPTLVRADRIEAIVPPGINPDRYLIYVSIGGDIYSQPAQMHFSGPPVTLPVPVITKVNPATPGKKTRIYGGVFDPTSTYVHWEVGLSQSADFVNSSIIDAKVPLGLAAGTHTLQVEVNGMRSKDTPFQVVHPLPLNLVWDSNDDNGIPLNPKWGWQSVREFGTPTYYPNPNTLRPWSSSTNQPLTYDSGGWQHASCGPHVNWSIPVTYQGHIRWSEHSTDDDYNFYMFSPNGAGATVSQYNEGGIVTEFDSEETIDHFYTSWWNQFHDVVDHNGAAAHDMVRNSFTIITAQWGLDCQHGCFSELHPVWAMAMHVRDDVNDDAWAMFVRNWGNQGWCGMNQHFLDSLPFAKNGLRRYVFRLPWRSGATSVSVIKTEFLANRQEVLGPFVVPDPGKGVLVGFLIPSYEVRPRVNGEIHLKWSGPSNVGGFIWPSGLSSGLNNAGTAASNANAVKDSEELELINMVRASLNPQQQRIFDEERASVKTKKPRTEPNISLKFNPNARLPRATAMTPRAVSKAAATRRNSMRGLLESLKSRGVVIRNLEK